MFGLATRKERAAPRHEGASSDDPFAPRFGEWLTHEGLIDAATRDRGLLAARQTGDRFDRVLIKLGLMRDSDLSSALARFLGLELVTAADLPSTPVLPEAIHPGFVRDNRILPLAVSEGGLTLAVADPLARDAVDAVAYLTGLRVTTRVMAPSDLERAVQSLYAETPADAAAGDGAGPEREAQESDLQRLRDIASEAPIIRLVQQIIADAVEARASDIHIEPTSSEVQVRYRIDGALIPVQSIEPQRRAAVTSRVKIMAKLDIAERRLPQDGRIRLAIRGNEVDLRISTLATSHGENIVMRILDRSRVELDFRTLGFSPGHAERLRRLMARPNGIILVTGPTGSGKTTTLYTALKELNSAAHKIFTVEDPIEHQLPGISQVQVQPQIGLDFPHALRSILRQDPDIIMIGEIRDLETARIAIQAALTGHLVFSTLHTNSSAATVTRMTDMGVEGYLLASTVKGILAQRLVRRLCGCARVHPEATQWASRFRCEVEGLPGLGEPCFKEPVGCKACRHTGFAGRSTVAELLEIDSDIHGLILESASDAAIMEAARRKGMVSMYQDGLSKAWRGETTIEEILRATATT